MFGQNELAKPEMDHPRTLHVVAGSPFRTIQGEGPYSGFTAIFLRLHGCNLRCFFCDTQFSAPEDPVVSVDALVKQITHLWPGGNTQRPLLVITGGEPARQNLEEIVHRMVEMDWLVQIETAGLFWQDCLLHTDIVVSPKTAKIHPKIQAHAAAFKYIIRAGEVSEEDGLPCFSTQEEGTQEHIARPHKSTVDVYVSPMDEYDVGANTANRMLVAEIAMKFGHRAMVQVHKILELA